MSDFKIGRVRFQDWTCPIAKLDVSDFKTGRVRLNPTFMSFVFKFKFQLEKLLGIPSLVALAADPPVEDVFGYFPFLLLSQAVRRGAA